MSVRTMTADLRAGIRAEWWTLAWMTVEAAVGIGAGVRAGSLALIAFGTDSVVELVSGAALLWRLRVQDAGGASDAVRIEAAERTAARIVGWSLVALAVYVVAQAADNLWTRATPESSPAGMGLAVAALCIMPVLISTKRRVAAAINSPALRGDAACGVVCVYMAGTLLAGLALRALFGWWWADPVAALGIVYFVVREAREALAGERACGCCD
jgi:divalent metal cation (Fe/Co/Zn/Cd) transporter